MDAFTLSERLLPLVWPLLLSALFLHVIPDLMRPGLFFGRTVDPAFRNSDAARAIRRRYTLAAWAATLIALSLAAAAGMGAAGAFAAPPALTSIATSAPLRSVPWLLQYAMTLCAFVWAHRAARPHALPPTSVVTAGLSAPREAPSALIVGALIVPIVSLGVLELWIAFHWHALPSQLPVHWGFDRPDRLVATSLRSVTVLLLLKALVCWLLALVAWGVYRGSRRVAASGEAARRERRFRTQVLTALIVVEYFIVFPTWAAFLALPPRLMTLWQLLFPAAILVVAARLLLSGQGGSRGLGRSNAGAIGDRTDDRHWALGLLYFNRADPAFMVEKRFGVGYSFNFGHPLAWALLAVAVAIPLLSCLI